MDSYSNLWARHKHNGFAAYNGIEITKIEEGRAQGVLTVRPSSLNPMGMVHGGLLAALADTVAGVAAATSGQVGVTLDCRMDYLRPAAGSEKIFCAAVPQRRGNHIAVYRAELTDDSGALVACGVFTFFFTGQPLPDFEAGSP